VKLRTLPPGTRSGLTLLALAGVALLVVTFLGWNGAGAAALSLFQSPPASPVITPAVSTAATAAQLAPTPAASAGLPIPLWLIVVIAAVIILLILGIILLRRR